MKYQKRFHFHGIATAATPIRTFQKRCVLAIFMKHCILPPIPEEVRYMHRNCLHRTKSRRSSLGINRYAFCSVFCMFHIDVSYFNSFLAPNCELLWIRNLLCVYFQERRQGILKFRGVLLTTFKHGTLWQLQTVL